MDPVERSVFSYILVKIYLTLSTWMGSRKMLQEWYKRVYLKHF